MRLNKNHIDTANVYNNIGEIYRYMGKYDKALPFIEKSMFIREKEQGLNALETAMSYNTLGVYYSDINKLDKSIFYLNKALKILELTLGQNHEYTIQTKNNILYSFSLINHDLNTTKRIGRNEQCLCRSGKKYKKCCS